MHSLVESATLAIVTLRGRCMIDERTTEELPSELEEDIFVVSDLRKHLDNLDRVNLTGRDFRDLILSIDVLYVAVQDFHASSVDAAVGDLDSANARQKRGFEAFKVGRRALLRTIRRVIDSGGGNGDHRA